MYPPNPRHIHNLDDVKNFPLDDRDLIICGFPRSGTNWLQVMFANLWDDWTTTANPRKKVPNLAGASPDGTDREFEKYIEGFEGYTSCIAVDGPRLMKCHLPRDLMPARWPDHGKVVYITRNPKDVCVSYYHLSQTAASAGPGAAVTGADFEDYVQQFARGEVPYGPYVENVASWHEFEHPNLLKVTYEAALQDTRGFLEAVIGFVGKPVDAQRLASVLRDTAFDTMKSGRMRQQINIPTNFEAAQTPFMRKGKVGSWKSEMSVELSEYLDRSIVHDLEEKGIYLIYE